MILRKDITAGTADAYGRRWEAFTVFCEDNGWQHLPASPGAVACYFGTLAERNLEPSTIRGYLTPIKIHGTLPLGSTSRRSGHC